MKNRKGTKKKQFRPTKVIFRQGFRVYDTLYGWYNGELYKINPVVTKLSLDADGRYSIVKSGKILAKELFKITEPIYYSHTDTERNNNAYRPALTNHGLKPGTRWGNVNQKFIKLQKKDEE